MYGVLEGSCHHHRAPPSGHSCEKLLIQVTQVLSPSYKLMDLGWRLALVVQRTGVGMRDAWLPSGSRVGAQIDTGDSTVHTDGCTRGTAYRGGSRLPGVNVPFCRMLIDPVDVPKST